MDTSWVHFRGITMGTPHHFILFYLLFFLIAIPVPGPGVESELQLPALRHSHGDARSEPHLQPTLQVAAMLDP